MATSKAKKKGDKIEDNFCVCCQRVWVIDDFYKTDSEIYGIGYIDICKDCVNDLFKKDMKKYEIEACVYYMCARLDFPFIKKAYEAFLEKVTDMKTRNPFYFGIYLTQLNNIKSKKDKWTRFSDSNVELGQIKKLKQHEASLEEKIDNLKLIWGDFDTETIIDDLQFLEYRFEYWTGEEELDKSKETLYRDLCKVELTQRKIEENCGDTKSIQSQKLSLMKTLKLDNIQERKEYSLVEEMIESQIKEIEENEPCDIFDPKLREQNEDYLKIKEGWEDVKRCLKNLLLGHKDYNIK